MSVIKPYIPKGTRDFSPSVMANRNFIFETIKTVFKKFGYQEIQTPAMENLNTLTGKYGDEGDRLIFKILNSGDYLAKANFENLTNRDSNAISTEISEKALRYDLTVPFARYVVMHQNEITFPFKRFQIQNVWRADKPQKGRYREFYQCDADIVGSDSLLNEVDFILLFDEALSKLGLKDFSIKINNRKILSGIAEIIGKPELIVDLTIAIDKLDKIGLIGVCDELLTRGFTNSDIEILKPLILLGGTNDEKIEALKDILSSSSVGLKGMLEIETIFDYLNSFKMINARVELDITLARGLNYYTGAIFEVKTNEVAMGSIGGGGRYDDLTGMFGLKDLSGVGISFGADRIYDVLEELNLFPESDNKLTQVLLTNFDKDSERHALPLLQRLRNEGVAVEIYHQPAKLKKQLKYADDRNISYVVIIGSEEMETNQFRLKNMQSGIQQKIPIEDLINKLKELKPC